jgi:hypothetical protein
MARTGFRMEDVLEKPLVMRNRNWLVQILERSRESGTRKKDVDNSRRWSSPSDDPAPCVAAPPVRFGSEYWR